MHLFVALYSKYLVPNFHNKFSKNFLAIGKKDSQNTSHYNNIYGCINMNLDGC
jgi:hypothetical protein